MLPVKIRTNQGYLIKRNLPWSNVVVNSVVCNNAGFKQAYTNEFDNQSGLVGEIHLTYLVVRVWLSVLSIRDWLQKVHV